MLSRFSRSLPLLVACAISPLAAQTDRPDSPKGRREKKKKSAQGIKPYNEVITKDAKSDPGLFVVHRVKNKVYYEIPRTALRKEMLWVTQIERTQAGHGYGGTSVGNRVVRWELRGEDILLRDVKYTMRAASENSVANAVHATSMEPIIRTLPVRAWGKDLAIVVDVTGLFMDDVPEFSAKRRLNATSSDKKRTFIEQVLSFPENIETKVLMTYKLSGQSRTRGGKPMPMPTPRRRRGPRPDPSQGGVTVLLHHSMVKLPDVPMQPREHDERVGFFSVSFEDYASDEHQVDRVRYITRWRLEKKDPNAEVSDPRKPIVFYVGRGVPKTWRPWVKKGIEAWQAAFRGAGFSNAIIARDAPSVQEDPDWSAEDARYSTIRWMPSTVENAMGPHVHDPRTGEILESDIVVHHNVLKLVRDWYFVQASPMDQRAQQLPMPDNLVGELLAYVISHEVGHTLGFPHNMKASSSYTVEQLRDPAFTKQNGTEASIMDYGRFNYVAQPGDGARLIPIVGPYDDYAVEWGYRQFPGSRRPADDKPFLRKLLARQVADKELRFDGANASEDAGRQTEDLSSDPIAATALGLKNIDRVADSLLKATCKPGEDYSLLRNMYEQMLRQRDRELLHVANVVGAVARENLWYGQADQVFHPEIKERQKQAIAFLNEHAFKTPKQLLRPEILRRLEASGAADRLLSGQRRLLTSLINDRRIKRMAENAAMGPASAYLPSEMLTELRDGVWSELAQDKFTIDLYRRNLQRTYIEILTDQIDRKDASTDLPALSRGELVGLRQTILERGRSAADSITRMHLADLRARIQQALDPRPKPVTKALDDSVRRR